MSIAHIFIDEYGTPSLETEIQGVTPYFIYTGVVIEEETISQARVIHKQIIDKYFGGTHIKHKNIKNDDKGHVKRIKVLAEILRFNHYVTALIIDKEHLDGKGFEYPKSFVKFFNNLFSKQFINKYSEYHLYFDKFGRPEFQASLKKYMEEKGHGITLFSNNTFDIKDDITEEPLIQFADFYSGCLGQYYCNTKNHNQSEAVHNIIKSRLFIEWFPEDYASYFGAASYKDERFNTEIFNIATATANKYIESSIDIIGCEIVHLLLQESHINPLRNISSGEIKRKISLKGIKIGDPINEIAKLRDHGVFIVSPIGKKGYKFPCNEHEIAEFFDRLSSNIIPQLKRGHILHQILIEQSFAKYNILQHSNYSILKSLIDIAN